MVERRMVRGDAGSPGSRGSIRSASSDPGLAGSNSERSDSSPIATDPLALSSSSLDWTSRSLGSRGSLCDEALDDCDIVNVVVRCRPLNERENKNKDESILTFPGEGQIWVNVDGINGQGSQKPKAFTYNVVYEPEATQEDVIEHCGVKKLIDMAIDGFSCTAFCYGQTGSGKTHTLTGPPRLFDGSSDMFSENHGLIFRSFVYLFNQLQNYEGIEFTIKASFLEIYNEKVMDLLNVSTNQKPLQVRWNKKNRAFFVENLFSIECYELDDLLAVLEEGIRNRAVAAHNMNEYSSRSHTLLTVHISSEQKAEGVTLTKNGKINFVDLAGSEMTKKTNSSGKTLEEANNINKSLLVLGTCIAALSDPRRKDGHIPYRDSKLTKLLADSLAGSGVTLMIACVSPAKSNMSETLNTLRYASRAKRIRTKPIIIMDPKEKAILALQREVNQLQEENQNLKMLLDLGSAPTPPGISSFVGNIKNKEESTGLTSIARTTSLALAATTGNPDLEAIKKGAETDRRPSFRVDDEKLRNLDSSELVALVKRYMVEHDVVKKENKELQLVSAALIHDQEVMAKENERLVHKLETMENGVPRASITSANALKSRNLAVPKAETLAVTRQREIHLDFGANNGGSQVWVNPLNDPNSSKKKPNKGSLSNPGTNRSTGKVPESINKEMERRQIGKSLTDLTSPNSSRSNSGSKDNNTNKVKGVHEIMKDKKEGAASKFNKRIFVRKKK